MSKERLSVSVDADLVAAVERDVSRRRAESMSAWVNDALRLKLAHERRLEALAAFVSAYEDEHGTITADEMQLARRRAQARAVVVRTAPAKSGRPARRRTGR